MINELQRIYQELNKSLFSGKLKPVTIAVQVKKKVSLRWFSDSETLIIGSEFLDLEYNQIPASLLHEMVHIYNFQRDVIDVTINQYHNKFFLQSALESGLIVIKHKTQGWSITSTFYPRNVTERIFVKRPSKDAIQKRITAFSNLNIDKNIFKSGKKEIISKIKSERPTKTYFLKYECQCSPPHNSIRSGRRPDGPNALNIKCQNCDSLFECVTELDY
jgi:hypothetical protein